MYERYRSKRVVTIHTATGAFARLMLSRRTCGTHATGDLTPPHKSGYDGGVGASDAGNAGGKRIIGTGVIRSVPHVRTCIAVQYATAQCDA